MLDCGTQNLLVVTIDRTPISRDDGLQEAKKGA
jgi:hypothetical protein